jgi:iron complex transport system substrate-binding protein
VVARLGAKNLVTEGPDTAQFPGFTSYSLERLAALDPDVILVISVAGPNAPPTSRQLAGNPAWSGLRAVRSGRVAELPAGPLVQSAGPRVGEVIDMLGPVLYPGRF